MSKSFRLLVLTMIISLSGFAQKTENSKLSLSETDANHLLPSDRKEIIKSLNLNDEQKLKLKTINLRHKSARAAIEADASLSAEAKKAKFAELRRKNIEDLSPILTPDQLKKYLELSKNRRSE
jgi:Spy/CpxP family protein refolding chaperone